MRLSSSSTWRGPRAARWLGNALLLVLALIGRDAAAEALDALDQVELDSYDFPLDDLRYGTGFGMRYDSRVGPISFDLGFPVQPTGDDQRWQVHVSLGSTF